VVAHVAVSLEGATTGVRARRRPVLRARRDVTLVGADTILAQEEALARGPGPAHGARTIVTGKDHVDLAAALETLDAELVRVDSGGWHGSASAGQPLELLSAEPLPGGLVWLRHRVAR
jgi:hypothetical protein